MRRFAFVIAINNGPDVDRNFADPLYMDDLIPSLRQVNPTLPQAALDEALYKLQNFESSTLPQKNARFMGYLKTA